MAVQLIDIPPETLMEYRDYLFSKTIRIESEFQDILTMYDNEEVSSSEGWQARYAFFTDILEMADEYRERALQGLYATYEEKRINSEIKETEERMCG